MPACDECAEEAEFLAMYYSGRRQELCEEHAKEVARAQDRPYKMKKVVRRKKPFGSQLKLGL